jgi:hypothetical protein
MIDYSDINFVINCAKKKGYIDICSIDIGNRNFALCIERLYFPIDKSETIINQTGLTKESRRRFLEAQYNLALTNSIQQWKPEIELIGTF